MENKLYSVLQFAFAAVFCWIIGLVAIGSHLKYACKLDSMLPNWCLFLLILVVFCLGIALRLLYAGRFKKGGGTQRVRSLGLDRVVTVLVVLLFLWQCYLCYNIFFLSGWDTQMTLNAANKIAYGKSDADFDFSEYFSKYPNNLLLVYIQAFILKINKWLGVFSGEYVMMSVVLVNCLINSLTCFLTYKAACVFTKKPAAFLAFCLAVLSFGLSAWSVICYSDAVALFVPILSVYLYVKPQEKEKIRLVYAAAAVAVSFLGYFIKPQCAFAGIAIISVECIRLINGFSLKKLVRPVALCLVVVITVGCLNGVIGIATKKWGVALDENKKMGIAHFLMMGLNEETQGVYSYDDVLYSGSFDTVQERSKANLTVAKDRLKTMGADVFKHLQRKLLVTFNDGTFAWGKEGGFYKFIPKDPNTKAAPFLRSLYYDSGKRYPYLSLLQHFVWLTVLCFSLASAFLKKNSPLKRELAVLWIVLLGFVLYELLFEVRARYVYIFVPVFCTLAAVGLDNAKRITLGCISKATTAFSKKQKSNGKALRL